LCRLLLKADLISEGVTLVYGGDPDKKAGLRGEGYVIEPTIFTGMQLNMKIYRQEVFGPFVAVPSFETEDGALQMANDSIGCRESSSCRE